MVGVICFGLQVEVSNANGNWYTPSNGQASNYDLWSVINWNIDDAPLYCSWNECGLQQWIDLVWNKVNIVKKDMGFVDFIKASIFYLYWFVALIGIIYIIYAWFRILISNGDEEAVKKSKSTILYAIIWIALIIFAWPITQFAISLGDNTQKTAITPVQ